MRGRRALVFIAGVFMALLGCVSSPPAERSDEIEAVVISGFVIRNELPYSVTDVMIEVPQTGNFAGCGTILARAVCRNRFEQRGYRDNAIVIRWREHGQPQQTDEFMIRLPQDARTGADYLVEVIVFGPGQAGARLVEAESAPIMTR